MKQLSWGNDGYLKDYEFFNRTEEIELLSNLLMTTQYGSSPSILITGIRKVGKTVLIKKLEEKFNKEFLFCYIDLSQSNEYQNGKLTRNDIIKIFYDNIIQSARKKGLFTTIKQIEKFFKTNNFSLSKFVEFKDIPVPILEKNEDYSKLVNYIVDLPYKLYEENNDKIKGVIIAIDEIQVLKDLDNDLPSFLMYLRSKIQFQRNVTYMFCGSMSTHDELINKISGTNGAFGGRLLNIEIKSFSKNTTKNYLKEKLPQLKLTSAGYEEFYNLTHGIPYYINSFANILPKNTEIDSENTKKYFDEYLSLLISHYLITWGKLPLREQKIVTVLLENNLTRKEIAEKLNVSSGSIGRALNHLLDLVLIEYYENKYRIIDPVLKYWLRKVYEDKGFYPFRDL